MEYGGFGETAIIRLNFMRNRNQKYYCFGTMNNGATFMLNSIGRHKAFMHMVNQYSARIKRATGDSVLLREFQVWPK